MTTHYFICRGEMNMENKEELKVIVDRVGLRRYDERSYVTINTEDEEKLIKLMKENIFSFYMFIYSGEEFTQ